MRGPGKLFESECLLSEVRIDEGIREDLPSSISSAGIELHPKQSQACTRVTPARTGTFLLS